MAYDAKNSPQLGRQLEVQKLVIPVKLIGNSTAASVSLRSDEPEFVFFRSQSVDQITAALQANETATYTVSASDSSGIVQCLVRINEQIVKVCDARLANRVGSGSGYYAELGSATGITTGTGGGSAIMLALVSGVDLTGANTVDACLEVHYIVQE